MSEVQTLANKMWEYYPLKFEDAKNIATSFTIWTSMYIVIAFLPLLFKPQAVTLKKIDDLDVRNRMISFVHGMTLLIVSGHQFYFAPGSCGDENTQIQKMLIYTAVGYFLYDMTALCYYGLVDLTMVIHHSICIVGMSLPLTYGMSANYIVMGMFIAESSNPFMHVRVILKHYGLRYTKAYEAMEITFMCLYMYGRILLGCGVVWNTCLCAHNHLMVRFCSAAIMAQSIFFVTQMIGILKKRFKEISLRKERRVKIRWFDPLNKDELEKLGIDSKKTERHFL